MVLISGHPVFDLGLRRILCHCRYRRHRIGASAIGAYVVPRPRYLGLGTPPAQKERRGSKQFLKQKVDDVQVTWHIASSPGHA